MMLLFVFLFCMFGCGRSLPNFVFILTDDQDLLLDGMVPMTNTLKYVANEGITFQHAFVHTPICCPSRSAILTGKYIHNLDVLNNSISGNCSSREWQRNYEPYSIANLLKRENYDTFYAGKYLNQYGSEEAGGVAHVPVGYDWWVGLKGNSKYYNYTLSVNGTGKYYENQYLTDVIREYALSFINQKRDNPFFMTVAPPACHSPFTPAERHTQTYPEVKALRTPSFNHTAKDKHWVVRMPPKQLPEDVTILDNIQRHRLQTLLAVDEMVEAIVLKLKELDVLSNTYIIFTSDNGFHIGQFTQPWDKRQPYETDISVPFLMSGPGLHKKVILKKPVSSVDIAPTILELAGVRVPRNMDGNSLKDHVLDVERSNLNIGSNHILIEYYGEGNEETVDERCNLFSSDLSECSVENWCKCQDSRNNTYSCIREITDSTNYKYCKFYDNEDYAEVYNLDVDPYELNNIYKDLDDATILHYENVLSTFLVRN